MVALLVAALVSFVVLAAVDVRAPNSAHTCLSTPLSMPTHVPVRTRFVVPTAVPVALLFPFL